MPRCARLLNEKQVYHVMLRGNNREMVFKDEEDKAKIIDILAEKKREGEFSLFAYCIMDNHLHLVIKVIKDPLSRIVKRIGTSYAHYFNKKYGRIGHVFQDRYKSENVQDEKYLLVLIRYVHQNPVKAGIDTIAGYRWSSYKEYQTQKKRLVGVKEILDIFSNNRQKAVDEFIRFNQVLSEGIYLDIKEKEIDEKKISIFIDEYLRSKNLQRSQLKSSGNKQARDELIKQLSAQSNLSLRKIAAELELNREMTRKAMSKEPSP